MQLTLGLFISTLLVLLVVGLPEPEQHQNCGEVDHVLKLHRLVFLPLTLVVRILQVKLQPLLEGEVSDN